MTYRTNLVAGSSLALFSIVYFGLSFEIKPFSGSGAAPLNSAFVPRLWGVCLFLLSLTLIARAFRERKAQLQSGELAAREKKTFAGVVKANYEVILTFLVIMLFIAGLKPIGFTIMSALYIFTQVLILTPPGKRKLHWAIIVGIAAAVVIDYVFVALLHVMLPRGILGF